jgi:Ser/Thr protein kinase RdoA (MazF antagonist)
LSGEAIDQHDERQAERLCGMAMARLGLSADDLAILGKGSPEKRVLAWFIRTRTTVSNAWLSRHLQCGHPANISGYIRSVERGSDPRTRKLKTAILKSED